MNLTTQQLTKEFPEIHGRAFKLGPIDLVVHSGEVLGVLGKNGAGKSTLFELLTGSLDATEGSVKLNDHAMNPDATAVRRMVGYMPQGLRLPKWVSAAELLQYAAKLHDVSDVRATVERTISYWDITSYQHLPVAACSGGMQKRTGLALATIHNPDLLILDEPFEALDLVHIRALEKEIERRRRCGKISLVSTHIADYAARLCTGIVTLDEGHLAADPSWADGDAMVRKQKIESVFDKLVGKSQTELHP